MTARPDPRGSARARIQRRQLAAIMLVACVVTPVFNVLTNRATLGWAIQGVVDGIVIPALVGGYLMFVRDGFLREWFRRFSFAANLAISGTIVCSGPTSPRPSSAETEVRLLLLIPCHPQ